MPSLCLRQGHCADIITEIVVVLRSKKLLAGSTSVGSYHISISKQSRVDPDQAGAKG